MTGCVVGCRYAACCSSACASCSAFALRHMPKQMKMHTMQTADRMSSVPISPRTSSASCQPRMDRAFQSMCLPRRHPRRHRCSRPGLRSEASWNPEESHRRSTRTGRPSSRGKFLLKREQVALPLQLGVNHLLFLCQKSIIRSGLKPMESLGGVNFYSPLLTCGFAEKPPYFAPLSFN